MDKLASYIKENRLPPEGLSVKTKSKIGSVEECVGFLVKDTHITARKPDTLGTYIGWVPGAGGDLWWIKHNDDTVAAYGYWELCDAPTDTDVSI